MFFITTLKYIIEITLILNIFDLNVYFFGL